ncbi:hypothetical protein, partial [Mesorhizobium sp. M7A.F.Ca.ET.027.03.2.1]|uniref:hypothetical protein n=2 Tax=unclassified Mesorhizobium TaxID=325217 RepID=UPI001676266B
TMSPETAGLASVASSSREIVGEHAYSQAGPTGLNLEREGRNAIGITKPPKWLKGQSNSVKSSNHQLLTGKTRWYRWLGSLSPSLAVFVTFSILPGVVCITIRITIGNTISAADIPPATRTDAPCIAYEAAQFLQKQEHSCIAQVKYRRHWTTNSFSHFPGCQNAPGFLMLERMGRTMYRCHNGTLDFGTELLTKPYTID